MSEFGDLKGLVVGMYGDVSQDLHDLILYMANSRAQHLAQSSGRPLSVSDRSLILGSLRRRLSVVAVRAQASCLLARVSHINGNAEEAANRRARVKGTYEVEKSEMQAHFSAYIRGKRPHTRGNLHP